MTASQVYSTNNNQIIIDLPEKFRGKEKLLITIDDHIETKSEKLVKMKNAQNDSLFLADIKEIEKDFEAIENNEI